MKGYLLLEDGTVHVGESFGAEGASGGEIVFNTAMTGYQEILTDPSYAGQIVMMTYPLIGNYGINDEDVESRHPFLSGLVVREYTDAFSNWRATKSLGAYLKENGIVAIEGVDTRAITKKIRSGGALRAMVGSESTDIDELRRRLVDIPKMEGLDLARSVACGEPYSWETNSVGTLQRNDGPHVVVIDCGVKFNILRRLVDEGARVTVVPPDHTAKRLGDLAPDRLLISNGPGDPAPVADVSETIRTFTGKIPIMGICLGHQLVARAIGAKTFKLKFGHHGANHPVREEGSGRIQITSQNHGFAVDPDSLVNRDGKDFGRLEVTHIHLTDGTIEGFYLPEVNVRAIQFHPEASPGPHDASDLFEEFVGCTKKSSIA